MHENLKKMKYFKQQNGWETGLEIPIGYYEKEEKDLGRVMELSWLAIWAHT